ncbi:unnamed protein product, partial [Effrenium voratum]
VDNIASKQMQDIRMELRGKATVLMGKNTMIRKALAIGHEQHPEAGLDKLRNIMQGNIGFIFATSQLFNFGMELPSPRPLRAPARARLASSLAAPPRGRSAKGGVKDLRRGTRLAPALLVLGRRFQRRRALATSDPVVVDTESAGEESTTGASEASETAREGATSEEASEAAGEAGEPAAAPWLLQYVPESKDASSDELLLNFLEALEERGVQLYRAQEEAILDIFSGCHVVLDTPTGSGKSLVAVAALFKALAEGGKAYYTSPTKALTSEKFFDLCSFFGAAKVGMATGDVSLNTQAPVVCCTAEVLASMTLRDASCAAISAVVMDEFHYFGDADRGWAWEMPLWRLSRQFRGPGLRGARFLLMSGTLGRNDRLFRTLQERSGIPVRVVSSTERPVPLRFSYSEASVAACIEDMLRSKRAPVYVVHFSQWEALQTARLLADSTVLAAWRGADGSGGARRARVEGASFGSPFGAELKRLLLCGVGVHHAGLLPCYRRLVEQLTQDGLLGLVCGTDTLGVGINVPIRSVLFTRLCKFDGEDTRTMRSREFHQIAGRAGRKGFDDRGDVVAVDPDWVVHNRELEQKKKRDPSSASRWRRPPRRNYQHWTSKTFTALQQSRPEPLKSQFKLSMAQCLALAQNSPTPRREIEDLLSAAQISRGAKRFWRRQAETYLRALGYETLIRTDAEVSAEPISNETAAPVPMDDGSLFISQTLSALQVDEGAQDPRPWAALAAAEPACGVAPALQRAAAEQRLMCPEGLEQLLFDAFGRFRSQQPWVPAQFLQPKGIAFALLSDDGAASGGFANLAERLGQRGGVAAEGALLRYLADVYRALRLGVPEEARTPGMRAMEQRLRQSVMEVDSSLISEWEALKKMEQGTAAASAASAASAARGAMVPALVSEKRRSRMELQRQAEEVRAQLEKQRGAAEAAERQRRASALGRLKAASSKLWEKTQDLWQDVLGLVWNCSLDDIREVLSQFKRESGAKAGQTSIVDWFIPSGPTGMDPSQTSFFQALNIGTKIVKGQIELVSDFKILTNGERVTASGAVLLGKLGIKPFEYKMEVKYVFQDSTVFSAAVLDMSEEMLIQKFLAGIANMAAFSREVGIPTEAGLPHAFGNALKNVAALVADIDFTFEEVEEAKKFFADPDAYAAANPGAAAAPAAGGGGGAAKKEEKKAVVEEEEEEEMDFDLFG